MTLGSNIAVKGWQRRESEFDVQSPPHHCNFQLTCSQSITWSLAYHEYTATVNLFNHCLRALAWVTHTHRRTHDDDTDKSSHCHV